MKSWPCVLLEMRTGIGDKQLELFKEVISKTTGLVLVCGPRRSGVTTTLYAVLREHDAFLQNLLSLEMQPLMDLENITQHIYDTTKHEASYARQLQTVLRREPDVVMVSDCPDRETAHLAAKAGGGSGAKKIYMGVQAGDSFDGLKKLVSLAGDMDSVADSLLAVVAQRLVRKLCIACRQAYRPDKQLLKKANLPVDKIEHFYRVPPEGLVDSKGNPILCPNCQGNGYFGRTGVYEILFIDEDIRGLIRKGQPINAIRAYARKNNMLYLQEVGLQKVIEGTTSMNEVLRALRNNEGDTVKKAATLPKKER
ncbi:MAG: GspE/PulE family protein [Planctomycetota bacterium]